MPRRAAGPVQAAPSADAPRIAPHLPVLLDEVRAALAPDRPGIAVDGTFGAGGYTRMLLDADPGLRVVAIDRDPGAIAAGAALVARAGGRLTLVPGRFGQLDTLAREAGADLADWVVLDVGVSSMQLDEAERGFSFRRDGPLDMRMERAGASAADLVNEAPEGTLADIFFHYGEERRSRAVARAVIEARRRKPITRTAELAEIVAGIVRAEPGLHPATRVFQGLRIAVNDELGELVAALHAAERLLKPRGRLAVVSFHSLEDRIVKQFIAARSGRLPSASRHLPSAGEAAPRSLVPVTKGPVLPGEAECRDNPRARSAKLRAAERTDAAAPPPVEGLATLAGLPEQTSPGHRR